MSCKPCSIVLMSCINSLATRGGHSYRWCSNSCDRGQKILTIVFVAWPLDRTTNGTLTVWPHTLDYTMCNTHAQNVNILTTWPTPKTALDPLTASWPRSQLWLQRLWEWPPLDYIIQWWSARQIAIHVDKSTQTQAHWKAWVWGYSPSLPVLSHLSVCCVAQVEESAVSCSGLPGTSTTRTTIITASSFILWAN